MELQNISEASRKETAIIKCIHEHLQKQIQNFHISAQIPRCSTPKPPEEDERNESFSDTTRHYQKFCFYLTTKPLHSKFRGTLRPSGFIGGHLVMKGKCKSVPQESNTTSLPSKLNDQVGGTGYFHRPSAYIKNKAEIFFKRKKK